jgi:hypothetical protein
MKATPKNSPVEKYGKQSIHYLQNSLEFLEKKELEKASEFSWGSVAQALKAVAERKGLQLRSHNSLREYARALAKEKGDESIYTMFLEVQNLHSNFYEADLPSEDVEFMTERTRKLVAKLLDLAGYSQPLEEPKKS